MLFLKQEKEVLMNSELNASRFTFCADFCSKEFMNISEGIVAIYFDMVSRNVLLPNNENRITEYIVLNYLKNDTYKETSTTLKNYHFDFETIENTGRADVRVLPINPYVGDKAYYVYECKRLDNKQNSGIAGLNAEYIKNGICRFVSNYYTSYYNENGMIGYVVEEMDIIKNIDCVNILMDTDFINDRNLSVNASPISKLKQSDAIDGFRNLYYSKHKTINDKEISLLHLIFDFSKNIE